MTALYQIQRTDSHVVTQVVKTELVVCAERDVARICFAALVAVRLVAVDTIHSQTQELVQRTVPFAVTFCQIVVDRHYVNSLMRQGVQVHRQRGYKGLTFTRCHLRYLTLVQYHTAEELYVVMDHIPCDLVSASHPVVVPDGYILCTLYLVTLSLGYDLYEIVVRRQVAVHIACRYLYRLVLRKTACGGLDDGKSLRKNLVQHALVLFLDLFFQLVHFVVNLLALLDRRSFYRRFQCGDTVLAVLHCRLQLVHQCP